MSEAPVDIPTSWWERVRADRRKLAAVLVTGVLALVLIGLLVVRPLLESGAPTGRELADIELPRIDDTSAEPTLAPGGDTTEVVGPGDESSTGDDPAPVSEDGDDSTRPAASPRRAPYIAYRLAGTIVVAREDGSDPVGVVTSAEAAFALSPDARSLAVVEGGELAIVTVSDGRKRPVGPAEPRGLEWRADSAVLYFMRAADGGSGPSEVWRMEAGSGRVSKVLLGGPPAVATDGTVAAPPVVGSAADPSRGTLWVAYSGGPPVEVAVRGQTVECAAEAGLVAYAVHGTGYTEGAGAERSVLPEIWTMRFDGTAQRRLVGPPTTARPFGYARLSLSPDARMLLYAEVGDDGYSRAYVVPVTGGTPRSITVRRDTYPLGWSADGSVAFFIEGNAFQGESTALMSVAPDGTARRTVVEGAGL